MVVEIGEPRRIDENEAACSVAIRGECSISDGARDIFGVGTLHALCLALEFARSMLQGLESKGCTLRYPDSPGIVGADAVFGRVTATEDSAD